MLPVSALTNDLFAQFLRHSRIMSAAPSSLDYLNIDSQLSEEEKFSPMTTSLIEFTAQLVSHH